MRGASLIHFNFGKYIGIDYSGAKRASDPLTGLRVFVSGYDSLPQQIRPDGDSSLYWSRLALFDWLQKTLTGSNTPCLVGIDHAFSFPEEYFALHKISRDWDVFLNDFCMHWPTDKTELSVADLLKRNQSHPSGRTGSARWRRLTEQMSRGAKSVFHFSVPGSVASSTHAGIPWLKFLRNQPQLAGKLHFWPFDGWIPEANKHVLAEVYPALWNKTLTQIEKTQDEHDAWSIALSLQNAFKSSKGQSWFDPEQWPRIKLNESQLTQARTEGWILGLQ